MNSPYEPEDIQITWELIQTELPKQTQIVQVEFWLEARVNSSSMFARSVKGFQSSQGT